MKRTLSLLVALALVFTMIPAVFAADNKEDIDMDGLTQGMEIDNPTPAEIDKPYTTTWLTFTSEEGGEAHGVHYFVITADEDGNLELTVDANGTVALEGVTANDDGTYPVEAGKKYIVVVTKDAEATEESTWSATYIAPHVHAAATYTNNGDGTHKVICECGEVVTASEAHNFVEGTCVCGATKEPETVYSVTDNLESLSLEGAVRLRQYWGFPGLTREQVDANEPYMVVTSSNATEYETYNVPLVYSGLYSGEVEYYGFTNGIPASRLVRDVTMQAFVTVDGVTYASEVKVCGVLDYCERQFAKAATTKNEKLKTTLVALLNYASEAQKNFKHDSDNLLNANLPEYVEKYNLNESYLELNWNDNYLTALDAIDANMEANFASTGTITDNDCSLSLEGAISIRYYWGIDNSTGKFTDSAAEMYFWTLADYAKLKAAGTPLSKENASYSVPHNKLSYSSKYGYEYDFFSQQIPSNELGNTLYAVMCVTDSDGVEHCSGLKVYSPETFAKKKLNDSKLGAVMKWMVVYGERATANFAK